MSPDELKARSRRLLEEVFNQGDLAVADELISPAYTLHENRPGLAPSGVDGLRQLIAMLRRAFPDINGYLEDVIADGNRVVQRISVSGTHLGDYLGTPPTGRRVAYELIHIDRFGPDGKITESWCIDDQLGLLQQIGAVPVPVQTGV